MPDASDPDRLPEQLLGGLLALTGAELGLLLQRDSGQWSVRAGRSAEPDAPLPPGLAPWDPVLRELGAGERPARFTAVGPGESEGDPRARAQACAPLLARGEMIGALVVSGRTLPERVDASLLEALRLYAVHASLLLQSARVVDGLRRESVALKQAVEERQYGELIGAGPGMKEVFRRIEKVAATGISVLVTGETGTGKEVVAREIHRRSPRAAGPFVAVNCAAIPGELLESELFGHARGSFTGATASRVGRFRAADGGTLFLDEIGEMPVQLQIKLLRALQDRAVTRVGDSTPEPVDIRVIAATHRVLEEEIPRGTFREDLYYRLNVVSIRLPPLRERLDDVLVFAKYFLQRYAREFGARVRGFTPAAVVALRSYGWPGNIRELENRVKKAVVLAERPQVGPEDLGLRPEELEPILPLSRAREEFQRRYINEVLERNGGNRTKTARDLEVDPRTIFRHLEAERAAGRPPGDGAR